jgi:hypothetical protein
LAHSFSPGCRLDLTNNNISALPSSLATIASLKAVVLDGNPLRSIRRDVISGGTVALMKYLRSRMDVCRCLHASRRVLMVKLELDYLCTPLRTY